MNLKQFNPLKVLHHWETLQKIIKGETLPPIHCEIDPSNLCNHNCPWCINGEFRESERSLIPREILFRVIEEMAAEGVKSIAFTGGGEPLVNPETPKALMRTVELGMDTALVTNAGLLKEEISKVLVDTCQYVRISLDAASAEVHRQMHRPRDPGEWENILKNVRHLAKLRKSKGRGPTIGIGFLVHSLNHHEIHRAVQLAKSLGADYIQIRPVFVPGEKLSDKVWHETESQIQESLKMNSADFHVFPLMHRFDEVVNTDRSYERCLGHALVGVVAADARMYVCCQLRGIPEFCFGDLREESFHDIWYGKKRQEVIARIDLNRCPPCRYNRYNEVLDFLADEEKPHKNFL